MRDQNTRSNPAEANLRRIQDALPPWNPDRPPLCRECNKRRSDAPDGYCEECR